MSRFTNFIFGCSAACMAMASSSIAQAQAVPTTAGARATAGSYVFDISLDFVVRGRNNHDRFDRSRHRHYWPRERDRPHYRSVDLRGRGQRPLCDWSLGNLWRLVLQLDNARRLQLLQLRSRLLWVYHQWIEYQRLRGWPRCYRSRRTGAGTGDLGNDAARLRTGGLPGPSAGRTSHTSCLTLLARVARRTLVLRLRRRANRPSRGCCRHSGNRLEQPPR